jgi:hypothetical protein
MAKIYHSAEMVIIWLGPDPEYVAGSAFDDVEKHLKLILTCIENDVSLETMNEAPATADSLSMYKIFRQPWFSRTWTIQEAGLAKCPIVRWGQAEIDWHKIGLVSMFFMRHCKPSLERCQLFHDVSRTFELYKMFLPLQRVSRLTYVLHEGRAYNSSDSRDKVYAFLAHPSAKTPIGDYMPTRAASENQKPDNFDNWRNLALVLAPSIEYILCEKVVNMPEDCGPLRPPSPNWLSPKRMLHEKSLQWTTRYIPGPSSIVPDYGKSASGRCGPGVRYYANRKDRQPGDTLGCSA